MTGAPPRIELTLLRRRVRVDRRGRAGVTLSWARDSEDGCNGTLRLDARVRSRRTRRTVSVRLGSRAFELAIGQTAVVRVRLRSAGLRLLRRHRSVSVRATALVRDGVGELRRVRRSYRVRAFSAQ